MGQDHGRGVAVQGLLDHFPRVDRRAVDGAAKQLLEGQHPVPVVQEQAAEHLVGPVPKPGQQELPAVGRRADGLAGCQLPPR